MPARPLLIPWPLQRLAQPRLSQLDLAPGWLRALSRPRQTSTRLIAVPTPGRRGEWERTPSACVYCTCVALADGDCVAIAAVPPPLSHEMPRLWHVSHGAVVFGWSFGLVRTPGTARHGSWHIRS